MARKKPEFSKKADAETEGYGGTCQREKVSRRDLRVPLRTHIGVQASLFDSGLRQEKAALVSTKADSLSLPEYKNGLFVAHKAINRATL